MISLVLLGSCSRENGAVLARGAAAGEVQHGSNMAVAPLMLDGPMHGAAFRARGEQVLIPHREELAAEIAGRRPDAHEEFLGCSLEDRSRLM